MQESLRYDVLFYNMEANLYEHHFDSGILPKLWPGGMMKKGTLMEKLVREECANMFICPPSRFRFKIFLKIDQEIIASAFPYNSWFFYV